MSKERLCPDCGEKIMEGERFCQNCGAEIPEPKTKEAPKAMAEEPMIGAGTRANIMGGVHKTDTTHNNVNTSNVDNSSTINNYNITYVVNEKKSEEGPIATSRVGAAIPGGISERGIGALGGQEPKRPERKKSSNNKVWILLVLLLGCCLGVFVLLNGEKSQPVAPVAEQEQNVPAQTLSEQPKADAVPVKEVSPASSTENVVPASTETLVQQPVVEKKDANYDAGMKAYEAGNGLDAVSAFQKSGSAKAYYMLGVIYENGCGNVGRNAMMARKNFKKAAQMGSEEAKAKL